MILSGAWRKILGRTFLLLFIWNVLYFGIIAYILPIRFEANDDVIMLLIASGKYSGIPEPHLVFINYIYGLLLTFLYSSYSQIEWYTVLFTIIHIVSLSVIGWSIISNKKKLLFKLIFLVLVYVLEVRLILFFQFTTTAALCALAGILLICCKKTFQQILGVLLFILGSLIRFDAALLVLIVISPIFLRQIIVNHKLKISKPLIFGIFAVLLIFIFRYVDYQSYQSDKNWESFHEYNKYRGTINDNPNVNELMNSLPPGISQSDFILFLHSFQDPKVFNLDRVRLISNQLDQVDFQKKIINIYPSLRKYTFLLFLILVIFGAAVLTSKDKLDKLVLLFSLFLFLFSLCYVSLEGTIKNRVFITAFLPLILVIFYCTEDFRWSIFDKLLVTSLCCLILVYSNRTFKIWQVSYNWIKTQYSEQNALLNKYLLSEKTTITPYYANLSIEYFPPFQVSKLFKENQIFFLGWITNIPLNISHFDSYMDLINRHAIFFAKEDINNALPNICRSILLNYGISVIPKTEMQSEHYIIVKF